jgi:hypothetical protein
MTIQKRIVCPLPNFPLLDRIDIILSGLKMAILSQPSTSPARVRADALRSFAAVLKWRGDPLLDDLVHRALGGHPRSLRMCRRLRIVVGRGRPLGMKIGPIENVAEIPATVTMLKHAVTSNAFSAREQALLLWAIKPYYPHSPGLAFADKCARIEGELAKLAAELGVDFVFTRSEGPAAARARIAAARRARAAACAAAANLSK